MRTLSLLIAVALGVGCDPGSVVTDAAPAPPDAEPGDAAVPDAPPVDAPVSDAVPVDVASPDAPGADASLPDAAPTDAALADAALADAAPPDASSADAAPSRATVRVFDADGALRPGAYVVRQRGDVVIEWTQTDASGEATIEVDPGDSVTTGFSDPRDDGSVMHRVVTWQDVEPGDLLTCGERGLGDPFATARVVPPGPLYGATYYGASSGCDEGGVFTELPIEYPLHAGCHADPAHVPMVVYAYDEGYGFLAYTTGEAAVVDGIAEPSLPAWRTDLLTVTNRFTHLPAGADAWGRLFLFGAGGERFSFAFQPTAPFSNEGTLRLPIGLGTSWVHIDVFAELQAGGSARRGRVLAGPMPPPPSESLDGLDVLPKVVDLTFAGSEPSRTSIGWSLDGPGDDVDAALVSSALVTQDGLVTWTVVAGPGSTSVELPPLPNAMAGFRPVAPPAAITDVLLFANDDAVGAAAYRGFRALLGGARFDVPDLETRITSQGARHLRTSEYELDARL